MSGCHYSLCDNFLALVNAREGRLTLNIRDLQQNHNRSHQLAGFTNDVKITACELSNEFVLIKTETDDLLFVIRDGECVPVPIPPACQAESLHVELSLHKNGSITYLIASQVGDNGQVHSVVFYRNCKDCLHTITFPENVEVMGIKIAAFNVGHEMKNLLITYSKPCLMYDLDRGELVLTKWFHKWLFYDISGCYIFTNATIQLDADGDACCYKTKLVDNAIAVAQIIWENGWKMRRRKIQVPKWNDEGGISIKNITDTQVLWQIDIGEGYILCDYLYK